MTYTIYSLSFVSILYANAPKYTRHHQPVSGLIPDRLQAILQWICSALNTQRFYRYVLMLPITGAYIRRLNDETTVILTQWTEVDHNCRKLITIVLNLTQRRDIDTMGTILPHFQKCAFVLYDKTG